MQECLRFRLLANQLEEKEFYGLLNKIGKEEMISHIFRSSLYIHQKYPNQQHNDITNINHMISTIITNRKMNESKDKNSKNTPNKPLIIDTLPTAMIRECASYLGESDYLRFTKCNTPIYIACNSPSTLQHLNMGKYGYPTNLNQFPLLKGIYIDPSKFNQCIDPLSNQLHHLQSISLDMNESNDHSEIESFMNTKYIDFTQIEELECNWFGSSEQLYDFGLFCKFLAQFPNVKYLDIFSVHFNEFKDEINEIEIGELFPKLKILRFISNDRNANLFRNKLIQTHSKQIECIDYNEKIQSIDIDRSLSLNLKELIISSPNIDSLSNVMKTSNNLQKISMNLRSDGINDKKLNNMITSIFSKYCQLNQVKFRVNGHEFDKIIKFLEIGLSDSDDIKRDFIKITYSVYFDDISIDEICWCLIRTLNALKSVSSIKHYVIACYLHGNIASIDQEKKEKLLNKFKNKYLIFEEINNWNDDNENFQRIIICNKDCKINGYDNIWCRLE